MNPQTMPIFRPLSRSELDRLVGWAADEGWNPGLQDADAFWAAGPDAYFGLESDGALIGGGAIVSYGPQAGFPGLFM